LDIDGASSTVLSLSSPVSLPAPLSRAIAIAIDRRDWHARQLYEAFRAAGREPHFIRLQEVAFTPEGLAFPGLSGLPGGVFVRAVAAGSFEEVTRRLGVLHALAALGVPVWNRAVAIERCVDKSATAFLLARAGLPTPPTWTVEGRAAAAALIAREGGTFVLKPLFGAQGRGLRLITAEADLPPPEAVAGVYHLQRFIPPRGTRYRDVRLLVCRGELVAAMEREAETWVTNVHQGGKPVAFTPPETFIRLALAATEAVGADYAGVDLILDREERPWILEVNSMPGWRGLQSVTRHAIAAALAARLLAPP
jgi:tetrahydromethanopterin:alpha-L-glutamate ligase